MIAQAVIDAIIDLAIPVSTAYQDVIGELEIDVLTEPDIKHTTSLVSQYYKLFHNFGSVKPSKLPQTSVNDFEILPRTRLLVLST
jgi:hypothetical protein